MAQTKETIDTSRAAQTGVGPTFIVAVEQYFPSEQRIIEDSLALQILPRLYGFMVNMTRIPILRNWIVKATENEITGGWSAFLVRKRYIDEKVVEDVDSGQVDAVINLGAGFDTRIFRLPTLSKVPVWELDQTVNIDSKEKRLLNIFGKIPPHVTLVRINFQEEDIGDVLNEHGYPVNTKTFFIWEAVSQYLTQEGVRSTFDFLSHAETGSRLAFTYVRKDFIEGKTLYGQEKVYKRFVVKDQIWHFGFDPDHLADFLSNYGWRLIEDISYEELGNLYVKPTGRELTSMEIERVAFAEKL